MADDKFWRRPLTNGTAVIIIVVLTVLAAVMPGVITAMAPKNHKAVCLIEPTSGRTIGLGTNSCAAYARQVTNKCTQVGMTFDIDGGFSRGETFAVSYICPVQKPGNYFNMYADADFCTNYPDSVGCAS